MLTVQITLSGSVHRITADQVEFVQTCHYVKCRKEFTTIDPDQMFCKTAHRVNEWRLKYNGPVIPQSLIRSA